MPDSDRHGEPVTPPPREDGYSTDSRCRRMQSAQEPAPRILFKREGCPQGPLNPEGSRHTERLAGRIG